MSDVAERLRARLMCLSPTVVEIEDESHRHAGHAGAAGGGRHLRLRIESPAFTGRGTLERHRMVYEAAGDLMRHEIHALAIRAGAPGEP